MGEPSKAPAQDLFDFEPEQKKEEPTKVEEPEPIQETPKEKEPSAFSRLWKKIGDMLSDEEERDDENA